MRKIFVVVMLTSGLLLNCGNPEKTVDFTTLKAEEFNSAPFYNSLIKTGQAQKQSHDSCMGFSFDANAIFSQSANKYFIGDVINRQSLKTVNTLANLGISQNSVLSYFNILTNPCYEKRQLHLPLKSLLGDTFRIQLPGAHATQTKEMNDAIAASANTEIETGSWVYLNMEDALKRVIDTIKTTAGLRYKENLLDTSNMILLAAESITDIRFTVNTKKEMSASLQKLLSNKPLITDSSARVSLQLYFLNSNQFRISFSGFFPIAGRFMKAKPE